MALPVLDIEKSVGKPDVKPEGTTGGEKKTPRKPGALY
jgi:hypothetical protein